MIVYHGSVSIIENPSVDYSKKYLDFGVGFYITTDKKQAENWAKRKAVRVNKKSIVNVYKLTDYLKEYKNLLFKDEDSAWLDYVANCRSGSDIYKKYDYVSGSVANDDVYLTVDMYVRGIWDKDRALSEIKYYQTSHQICLINQELVNNELEFDKSYEVK